MKFARMFLMYNNFFVCLRIVFTNNSQLFKWEQKFTMHIHMHIIPLTTVPNKFSSFCAMHYFYLKLWTVFYVFFILYNENNLNEKYTQTHTQCIYVTQTSFEFYELTWHNGLIFTNDQMQDFCGSQCTLQLHLQLVKNQDMFQGCLLFNLENNLLPFCTKIN